MIKRRRRCGGSVNPPDHVRRIRGQRIVGFALFALFASCGIAASPEEHQLHPQIQVAEKFALMGDLTDNFLLEKVTSQFSQNDMLSTQEKAPSHRPSPRIKSFTSHAMQHHFDRTSMSEAARERDESRRLVFARELVMSVSGAEELFDASSVQYRALEWISNEDKVFVPLSQPDWMIQRYVLAVLFYSTAGEEWFDQAGFLSSQHECEWYNEGVGIICDDHDRVIRLHLGRNGLVGYLPSELGWLDSLTELYVFSNALTGHIPSTFSLLGDLKLLYMWGNHLTGTLPDGLGRMTNLVDLQLSKNMISGSIPQSIQQLAHLETLLLDENNLIGDIPEELGFLRNLKLLILSSNKLTGSIPLSLGQLKRLEKLSLSNNELENTIPSELGGLVALTELSLSTNNFSGHLSSSLGELSALVSLKVDGNQLGGTIPPEIGRMSSVVELTLNSNGFVGSIPFQIANLQHLSLLSLWGNKITGTIPGQIGQLSNLKYLYLSSNALSGSIPTALGSLSKLQQLRLQTNKLTGCIPSDIGQLTFLKRADLSSNRLVGSIPSSLERLSGLVSLTLSHNSMTGSLPRAMGRLTNLEEIYLDNNEFTGILPPSIGTLGQLTNMFMQNNHFSGSLPSEIGGLSKLQNLLLASNKFNGKIPSSIGMIRGLKMLNAGMNSLTGIIPEEIGNLSRLQELYLYKCTLEGRIPGSIEGLTLLTDLSLWGNKLEGTLPQGIGKLTSMRNMDISSNNLSGTLPSTVGSLENLITFVSLNNKFSGEIPVEISRLKGLMLLYLNNNRLTGAIPDELGENTQLVELVLSNNTISGSIPRQLSRLTKLEKLQLDNNKLSGTIPLDLGSSRLRKLRTLSLNSNRIHGVIPAHWELDSLRVMNVSDNILSGQIPENLGVLKQLSVLDLSQNKLEGSIPLSLLLNRGMKILNLFGNHLRKAMAVEFQKGFASAIMIMGSAMAAASLCWLVFVSVSFLLQVKHRKSNRFLAHLMISVGLKPTTTGEQNGSCYGEGASNSSVLARKCMSAFSVMMLLIQLVVTVGVHALSVTLETGVVILALLGGLLCLLTWTTSIPRNNTKWPVAFSVLLLPVSCCLGLISSDEIDYTSGNFAAAVMLLCMAVSVPLFMVMTVVTNVIHCRPGCEVVKALTIFQRTMKSAVIVAFFAIVSMHYFLGVNRNKGTVQSVDEGYFKGWAVFLAGLTALLTILCVEVMKLGNVKLRDAVLGKMKMMELLSVVLNTIVVAIAIHLCLSASGEVNVRMYWVGFAVGAIPSVFLLCLWRVSVGILRRAERGDLHHVPMLRRKAQPETSMSTVAVERCESGVDDLSSQGRSDSSLPLLDDAIFDSPICTRETMKDNRRFAYERVESARNMLEDQLLGSPSHRRRSLSAKVVPDSPSTPRRRCSSVPKNVCAPLHETTASRDELRERLIASLVKVEVKQHTSMIEEQKMTIEKLVGIIEAQGSALEAHRRSNEYQRKHCDEQDNRLQELERSLDQMKIQRLDSV